MNDEFDRAICPALLYVYNTSTYSAGKRATSKAKFEILLMLSGLGVKNKEKQYIVAAANPLTG